jgi:hypothetical protein
MFVKTIIAMRKNFLCKLLTIVAVSVLIFTLGCKRTEIPVTPDPTPTNPIGGVVNDAAQVTASVSGIVLDETNAPIANAVVTSGTATTTTNTNGMFIFQNISLSKENGNVTVVKAGYFKGIRSFKTTEGKNHTVKIQLMQRVLSGTVNAAAGGTINSNGGATIIFPANAFVTSTGAAYTGTVSVYSRWIDPTAANLPFVIPGDLRGVSTTGVENILETYGMVGAELADASGNILKIATGKTATVSFPIPASLSATAPASIVLWHFDEASTRWKENGTATKTGSTYTAQVDKFSFWNCDVPSNFINLDYSLINATTNTALIVTSTRIKRVYNGSYGYGITNNTGFVSGAVPKNEALVLEVLSGYPCNTVVYSQNIGPFATNTSLGNILINTVTNQTVTFTGTLTNCSGGASTIGYVSLAALNGIAAFGNTNANGAFSFSVLNCTGNNLSYNYQGTDVSSLQQSAVLNGIATSNTVNLGNLVACNLSSVLDDIYVAGGENGIAKVWKNGIGFNLSTFPDTANANAVFISGTDVFVAGIKNRKAVYWKNGVLFTLSGTNEFGTATSIYVDGNDVYISGNIEDNIGNNISAKVWKNGIATTLSSVNSPTTSSVFVSGADVYVAGRQNFGANLSIAKLWKNGNEINLTSDGITNYGSANSIFIYGNDVYVAGFTKLPTGGIKNASVWKNGSLTSLNNGFVPASANSIFVSGNDVYVGGTGDNPTIPFTYVSKLWKNGIAVSTADGIQSKYISSIYVKDNNVYSLLSAYSPFISPPVTPDNTSVYKNGLITNFFNSTNSVYASSIFVK